MKKYFSLLILSVAVFSLSSCLKDDKEVIQADNSPSVVEFRNPVAIGSPSGAIYPMFPKSFGLDAATVNYSLTIAYTGATPAPQDIPLTIDINDAAVTAYNTQQSSTLTIMPTTLYTLNNATATIAKGTFFTTISFTFKPQSFDFTKTYGLAVRIKSATGATISSNFGTIILAIGAKNKYDGVYKVTGSLTDANGVYRGFYPTEVEFRTIDAQTVNVYNRDFGGNYYIFNRISDDAYLNGGSLRFKFDTSTDKLITITNQAGGAFQGGAVLDATGNTMSFTGTTPVSLNAKWKAGAGRYTVDETYKYSGAR